jgi:hypothetical protein
MMPTTVMWFEVLSYLSLLLTLISASLSYSEMSRSFGEPVTFGLIAFLIAFSIFLISSAARRRKNWARWFLLIAYVVGVLFSVPTLADTLKQGGPTGMIEVINLFLDGAATYLIFSPSARPWFAKQRSKGRSRAARLFAETGKPYGEYYYSREYIPAVMTVIIFFSVVGLNQLLPVPFSLQSSPASSPGSHTMVWRLP